jgi:hypothetical protein
LIEQNCDSVGFKFKSCSTGADLTLSAEPFELSAGWHHKTYSDESWTLMPLKPIMLIEGTRLTASTKENDLSPLLRTKTTNIILSVGVEKFTLNVGSSTICSMYESVQSLSPFLEWFTVDIEEERRQQLEKQNEIAEYQCRLQKDRQALREMFETIDTDGSGTLNDVEMGEVIRLMFEKDATCLCEKLAKMELKTQQQYFLSILDPATSNDISYQEVSY